MIDGRLSRRYRGYRSGATGCTYRIRVSDDDYHLLRSAAGKRGQAPVALLTRLIEILIRDKLIDAVLDDGNKNKSAAGAAGWR